MVESLNILLVEDNPGDVGLIQNYIENEFEMPFHFRSVETLKDMFQKLKSEVIDLILLDLALPDSVGINTVTEAIAAAPDIPVIVLTGTGDQQLGLAAIEAGADDFMVKADLDPRVMIRTMRYAIRRKEAIKNLSESRARFKSLILSIQDVVIVIDEENKISQLYKPSDSRLFSDQEVIEDRHFMEIIPSESAKDLLEHIDQVRASGYSEHFEFEYSSEDQEGWFSATLSRHEDDVSVVAVIRDITDLRESQSALEESEERAQLLIDAAFDGVVIHDNFKILEANQQVADMFETTQENLLGKSLIDYWTPESQEIVRLNTQQDVSDPYDVKHVRKDGSIIIVEGIGRPCRFQGKNARIVALKDRTERTRTRESVAKSEKRYRMLYERMEDGFTFADLNGNFLALNQAFLKMTGYRESELLDKTSYDVTPEKWKDKDKTIFETQVMRVGYSQLYEKEFIRNDGTIIPVEIRVHLMLDDDGRPSGTWAVIRDISNRKKNEEKLERTAEAAIMYLDIMGHDIRNHLQAIIIASEIMSHYETSPEIDSVYDLIVESVTNSQSLIEKVRSTRGLLQAPLHEISLSSELTKCIKKVRDNHLDVQIDVVQEVEDASIQGDEFTHFMLGNLLENAIKFNPSENKRIWISLKESDNGYTISIADNGAGITDDRKASLFNPEKRFGGVGIHQAKFIVEKYEGTITVQNRIPDDSTQGAEFKLLIPKSSRI